MSDEEHQSNSPTEHLKVDDQLEGLAGRSRGKLISLHVCKRINYIMQAHRASRRAELGSRLEARSSQLANFDSRPGERATWLTSTHLASRRSWLASWSAVKMVSKERERERATIIIGKSTFKVCAR